MTRSRTFAVAAVVAACFIAACAPTTSPEAPATAPPASPQPGSPAGSGGSVPPATSDPGSPSAPATPAPPRNNVILERPAEGETIRSNPVAVAGKARTFENNVQIRLRDARGAVIRQTFATAEGELGNFNPFSATIYVTRDPGNRITVDAYELSAKDGSLDSLDSATLPFDVPLKRIRLFLPRGEASASDCTKVFPLDRDVPASVSLARLLVEALIDGPTAAERSADYSSPFPPGSGVDSVNLRSGTIRVDFTWRLQNVGGSCRAQSIRAAVTATLKNLPEITDVVISAGGSEAMALQP